MSIIDEVSLARQDIRTDDYSMSIGEWISLYESKELDIHPEFQRFFRWTEQQKSNLIESILLGIPLPPIFVSQRRDGVWDVIDGLQRLSTLFQFVGILTDEQERPVEPLSLKKTTYLPSLEGKKWESDVAEVTIPDELKRSIKRSKINVSIILKESNENTKYDLFQRLNTGGSQLSPQEVRNCILVMVDPDFYRWVHDLSRKQAFQESIALSDKPLAEAYDLEQVLRFLILSEATEEELAAVGDLGVYLNTKMVDMAKDPAFDRDGWARRFGSTFDLLNDKIGDNAFKRYSVGKGRHEGGFLVSQFEAVACGVAWNLERASLREDIADAVAGIWSDREFTDWTGSGVTAARRLRRIVPFARRHFAA
ncbi:DUF262 domain-containing protein [Amaricoccus sp.]|uniref:DUF262 domain-containing protein n=1 Tax=Amaricoccus sp. TaxID=1872485 RepID=UPI001B7918B8|nr:DUF262 domain-containing protein [Amaricoccus sp.]MBP7002348.1 DUF262 domain-containing protein [Amaricoccus sp.]